MFFAQTLSRRPYLLVWGAFAVLAALPWIYLYCRRRNGR
ncbi:hypothetical protein Dpep_1205 [Dethiosulfovibrio peptidovorans DSM 11002]|jgi:cyanate permease|uniref:Uncharacterized protein n=1 Tax=Dethiosulfovibrio peptidovorans DSM 11002 TaxID=469381 RepID=D2Z6Y4_9BACT|nr:hypothetical protein Dpep_1205 [Dethiosulfovibrio peptidovorans DSM 11002]